MGLKIPSSTWVEREGIAEHKKSSRRLLRRCRCRHRSGAMSAKTEVTGALSVKYIGESPPEGKQGTKVKSGRHVGPTIIGSFGDVVLERKVDDVKYTLRATETTIQNLRGLNAAVLTVAKPFGPITATGGLELGPVRALTANVKSKWNYSKQRLLELGAYWNERTGATTLTFVGQPHAKTKLTNVVNTKTNVARSVAEFKHRGFTVAPGIEWKSGAKGVTVSRKLRAGTLRGSYAHENQTAGLEYDFKPFKVTLSSKFAGKDAGKPSLTLQYKTDSIVRQVKDKTGWKRQDKGQGGKVPEVRRDIPLDVKLKELDALYAPKLAEAEASWTKNDAVLKAKSK